MSKEIDKTRVWLESVVIGLNLCPFAKRELVKNRIHFTVSTAQSEAALMQDLHAELIRLSEQESIATTLLIHPAVLQDFFDYNQFLDLADDLLRDMDLEGVFQIASFHPDYQFAGADQNDPANYSNRSPYPMLHILREAQLEDVIETYPDVEGIPERNINLLRSMGLQKMTEMLDRCDGETSKPEPE